MGGRGSVTGSLIGAFVIGVLADGLVMLGVSEFWQIVIKGVVIVLAVGLDQLQTRLQARILPYLTTANLVPMSPPRRLRRKPFAAGGASLSSPVRSF